MNKAAHIQGVADALIAHAEKCGVVLTIDAVPQLPLAMGNVKMVAHARPARSQPQLPAFDMDAACTLAFLRVHDFIEQRAARDKSDLAALFHFDRQQLADRMDPHIRSAKCRGWMYRFLGWTGDKS